MKVVFRFSVLISIFTILLCQIGLPLEFVAASSNSSQQADSTIDFPALDAYITAQMAKHDLKGISLAITQDKEIIYLQGYGTAGAAPMTPQTPMYIGSQSKSFTALAIAQLAEQGLIDYNAPVQVYIPWFKVADPEASAKITVNHLLHHTSGLSESGFLAVLPDDATSQDAARALAGAKLTAPVGSTFQYFNIGYDVLALIIENVSGQPYAEYVKRNIFDPLGMTHTYTDPALARADGLSQGYSRFFGFIVPREQPHRVYEVGAGYIISTAEDMAHYAIAMNNDAVYDGTRLLQPDTLSRMFRPVNGYGMGWFIEPYHIYHGGANETFKTYVDLYPGKDLGIVLLINQGYMADHYISAPQVFEGVESIVLGFNPPLVSKGWSVRTIGWGLLAFVLALIALHGWNFYRLKGWSGRAQTWSTVKLVRDVAVSFIIPTAIMALVIWQMKNFFGYRFNLTYQMLVMFSTLTDICILMILGTIPDYLQGFIKLFWLVSGKARR